MTQPVMLKKPKVESLRCLLGVLLWGRPFQNKSKSFCWRQPQENLQDLLEYPKNNVLFIIGDWNAKVGSQEIPEITGNFGLGIQNEAGQRLTEFCKESALVIANTLFQ